MNGENEVPQELVQSMAQAVRAALGAAQKRMDLEGWTGQVDRAGREHVRAGSPQHKRLLFYRGLYQKGAISEGVAT